MVLLLSEKEVSALHFHAWYSGLDSQALVAAVGAPPPLTIHSPLPASSWAPHGTLPGLAAL